MGPEVALRQAPAAAEPLEPAVVQHRGRSLDPVPPAQSCFPPRPEESQEATVQQEDQQDLQACHEAREGPGPAAPASSSRGFSRGSRGSGEEGRPPSAGPWGQAGPPRCRQHSLRPDYHHPGGVGRPGGGPLLPVRSAQADLPQCLRRADQQKRPGHEAQSAWTPARRLSKRRSPGQPAM